MWKNVKALFSSVVPAGLPPERIQPLLPSLDPIQAYHVLAKVLDERRPFLVSRLGFTESDCLGGGKGWRAANEDTIRRLQRFSGVFPPTKSEFRRFADTYLRALENADMLGLIGTESEARLIQSHAPSAQTCELGSLEPYFCPGPWSRHLEGLSVCVVHPFVSSIRRQYDTVREKLFTRAEVLPAFKLSLVQPPQTIAGNTLGFKTWSDALESLKSAVMREEFDVAILGCGAYGLPLGAFLKSAGKTVIHIGGATQMMFGVLGARWRDNPLFKDIINEHWQPPMESERPEGWQTIENGCYW